MLALKTYQNLALQNELNLNSPHNLISLLFEGFKKNIYASIDALENNNIEKKCFYINKSLRILDEGLKTTLDLENGQEIAQNLNNLYNYCIKTLLLANLKNDINLIKHVLEIINPIIISWKQIKTSIVI